MTRTRLGAALALLALALLALPGAATGAPTWEGTWSSTFGEIKMSAGGSGTYPNCGTISGGLSDGGLTNKGTWTECSSNGKYEFHMSASGGSFTGTYTRGTSDTCVSPPCTWNGTCIAGPCKDPPPKQPVACGSSAANALAAAKTCDLGKLPFGTEFSVPGPKPGSTVNVSPKPIPATADEVLIALRELILEEEANKLAAAIAARLRPKGDSEIEFGTDVGTCIVLFSDGDYRPDSPRYLATVDACTRVVAGTVPKSPARTAAAGCDMALIPIVPKDKATKRRRRAIVAEAKQRLDISCKRRAGRLRASIETSNGKPLSSVIERRLRTGAGRQLRAGEQTNARLGVRWTARRP